MHYSGDKGMKEKMETKTEEIQIENEIHILKKRKKG